MLPLKSLFPSRPRARALIIKSSYPILILLSDLSFLPFRRATSESILTFINSVTCGALSQLAVILFEIVFLIPLIDFFSKTVKPVSIS